MISGSRSVNEIEQNKILLTFQRFSRIIGELHIGRAPMCPFVDAWGRLF